MGFRINKLTELTYVSEGLERGLINGWRPFENKDAVSALRNVLYSRYGYILARTAVKRHIKTYFRIYTYLNGVYIKGCKKLISNSISSGAFPNIIFE